jgi:hypothetical protein
MRIEVVKLILRVKRRLAFNAFCTKITYSFTSIFFIVYHNSVNNTGCFFYCVPKHGSWHRLTSTDAGILCDTAVVFGETVKWTICSLAVVFFVVLCPQLQRSINILKNSVMCCNKQVLQPVLLLQFYPALPVFWCCKMYTLVYCYIADIVVCLRGIVFSVSVWQRGSGLLEYYSGWTGKWLPTFRRGVMPPSSCNIF